MNPLVSANVTVAKANVVNVTQDNPGTDTFYVTIRYDQPMHLDNANRPTVTFTADTPALTAEVNATLVRDWETWVNNETYLVVYNVVNTGAVVPSVDISVEGAVDAAGYEQARSTTGSAFSIDMTTAAPLVSVAGVSADYALVTGAAAPPTAQPAFWVKIHYAQPVSTRLFPTITLWDGTDHNDPQTAAIQSAMTYDSSSTWISSQDFVALYDVTGAAALSDVYVGVAGAEDLTGNAQVAYASPAKVFNIDTADATPAVASVTSFSANMATVTQSQVGSLFSLRIVYDQSMDNRSRPTIVFNPPWADHTLVYNEGVSTWTGDKSFVAVYDVVNPTDPDPALHLITNVGVTVTGAVDLTHRVQNPFTASSVFDIDTAATPASVVATAAHPTATVTDANVGPDGFWVTILYDRPMNQSISPVVGFVPDPNTPSNAAALAGTLSLDYTVWINSTVFAAVYNVTDVGAAIPYVGVTVKGAMDPDGNPQFRYEGDGFSIAMQGPPQQQALTDAVLSLSVGTQSEPTAPQSAALTPVDYALLYSGTWLDA